MFKWIALQQRLGTAMAGSLPDGTEREAKPRNDKCPGKQTTLKKPDPDRPSLSKARQSKVDNRKCLQGSKPIRTATSDSLERSERTCCDGREGQVS